MWAVKKILRDFPVNSQVSFAAISGPLSRPEFWLSRKQPSSTPHFCLWNSMELPTFSRLRQGLGSELCKRQRPAGGGRVVRRIRRIRRLAFGVKVWVQGHLQCPEASVKIQCVYCLFMFFFMFWPTKHCFFPTCQVRVVRFYQSCSPPPPPHPPPPPRSPDPSGHSRTSTASSRSQWALPGPQPRVADRSGHCRTSTATSRSQWALPDLNRELQIPVGTAGPQPRAPDPTIGTAGPQRPDRMLEDMPDGMSDRMPEDMPDRMPEDMPDRMPEDMSDRMPEDMPDRMPEDLPDRMPEDMPEHMPENMPDRMPDRMPEDMSDRMPEDLPVINV